MKKGFDKNLTYYEKNIISKEIPTIFIHGVGLDNTMWLPQKKYFKNKKNVIFYDILNHGKSKKNNNNLNFNNFNSQLINLISFLKIKKFNLIGFSLGALIAQHFASKYYKKINKLIIIGSIYKRSKSEKEKVKNRYSKSFQGKSISKSSINRWFKKNYLKNNPKVFSFFYDILEKNKKEDFLPAYKLFIESDDYKINFSNYKMPALLMTGEKDIGSTPEMSMKLHKKIKKSKLKIIPEAKHMATFEKSKIINKEINNFLL